MNPKGPADWLSGACVVRTLAYTVDCRYKGLYHLKGQKQVIKIIIIFIALFREYYFIYIVKVRWNKGKILYIDIEHTMYMVYNGTCKQNGFSTCL